MPENDVREYFRQVFDIMWIFNKGSDTRYKSSVNGASLFHAAGGNSFAHSGAEGLWRAIIFCRCNLPIYNWFMSLQASLCSFQAFPVLRLSCSLTDQKVRADAKILS